MILRTLGALAAALCLTPVALAQAWPSKPIRIIVPYPPGGSSDIIARAISKPLSEALKQTVIIENKPGANGNTGTDYVAKSAPDGHTFLLCDVGALAITASVYSKLPFDPSKDLRGVTMLAYSPHLLVVHPSVPASNLAELVALSQKQPLNFAVTAIGSAPHVAGVAIERATGAKWTYIPYKGGSQAIGDTVAGQTQVLMNGMLATLPFVESGKLKVIGVQQGQARALAGQRADDCRAGRQGLRVRHLARRAGACRHAEGRGRQAECRTHHHHPFARGARAPGVARRRGLYDDAGRVHAVLRA